MVLRTDYKDSMFDGARKYRINTNPDGTSGIVDETTYTQAGDPFGANDINATNGEINRINHVTEVALTASGWTGSSAPFVQTVNVPGAASDMEPVLVSALADGVTLAVQKAYSKAFGIICSGTATVGNGTVTFKTYKKPDTDCTVGLKGV